MEINRPGEHSPEGFRKPGLNKEFQLGQKSNFGNKVTEKIRKSQGKANKCFLVFVCGRVGSEFKIWEIT